MTSESVNALKQLQLIITPKLQLMKAFNDNYLLLFSLSVVTVIQWCHFTDASQQWKIF